MSDPEFVGLQVAADNCAHFMTRKLTSTGVKVIIQRVPITKENSFSSIEDILSNVKLIPLEEQKYTQEELTIQVGRDNLTSHGKYFPEYGIVATNSIAPHDRIIALVHKDGKKIYIPHPEIGTRVRRFVPKETT